MTEIKICGITDLEDALFAAACRVEALGFIFYDRSPRYIAPSDAKRIIAALPPEVARVGVFVNQKPDEVQRIFEDCGLDYIQLHGDETPAYCRQFPPSLLIKAVSLTASELSALAAYQVQALLVDSRAAGCYGGTGRQANWKLARRVKENRTLILSGGLREENIAAALAEVSPDAVDINSGVEIAPGRKDHDKVRRMVDIIRGKDDRKGVRKLFIPRPQTER